MQQLIAGIFLSLVMASASAQGKVDIGELAWMTGAWAGPLGEGRTLEENWIQATDGSIASLVRITGNGETSMIELIVIEAENDTLVLRVQQFDPGFSPRTPAAHVMTLVESVPGRVSFKAVTPGTFSTLAYSRPTPGAFYIDIGRPDGAAYQIKLQARQGS